MESHDIYSHLLHNDLSSFIEKSFETLNPGTSFLPNWHIDVISEYLRGCVQGSTRRLVVNMPPRFLKSMSISVAWPAWLLGRDPSKRIIVASYSQYLSLKHAADCRALLQSA